MATLCSMAILGRFLWCQLKCIVWVLSLFLGEASMLGHGAGIGYTGPDTRMGPIDNFSLVTGSICWLRWADEKAGITARHSCGYGLCVWRRRSTKRSLRPRVRAGQPSSCNSVERQSPWQLNAPPVFRRRVAPAHGKGALRLGASRVFIGTQLPLRGRAPGPASRVAGVLDSTVQTARAPHVDYNSSVRARTAAQNTLCFGATVKLNNMCVKNRPIRSFNYCGFRTVYKFTGLKAVEF